jgi:purine-binding chemotaxis protein CheW
VEVLDDAGTAEIAGISALLARAGGARFIVPAARVGEVLRMPELTRVPGLPSWLPGVANIRGQVLSVVDLRPLLGLPLDTTAVRPRLLRVDAQGIEVGLRVDAVDGVADLDLDESEPLPPGAAAPELFAGVITVAGAPLPLLEVPALVALRDRLV